jgi:hypothetical protein
MSDITPSQASGISNTINSNTNSISSFTQTTPEKFTANATSTITSAVSDPIAGVLNKTLSKLANVSSLATAKVDDLTKELDSYQAKNGQVQIIGNQIVITVTSQNVAQGEAERNALTQRISSIKNTLTTLTSTIGTLSTISNTVSVVQKLLTVQEALLNANPVTAAAFTVFKTAIKVVFLKDMLNSYTNVISSQLSQNQQILDQLTQKFLSLQVTLNVQDQSNTGNQVSEQQAASNVSQNLLGGDGIDSATDTFTSFSNVTYILKVEKLSSNQLVGRAYDQASGQLAAQTSPSYISSAADLLNEIKQIVSS